MSKGGSLVLSSEDRPSPSGLNDKQREKSMTKNRQDNHTTEAGILYAGKKQHISSQSSNVCEATEGYFGTWQGNPQTRGNGLSGEQRESYVGDQT